MWQDDVPQMTARREVKGLFSQETKLRSAPITPERGQKKLNKGGGGGGGINNLLGGFSSVSTMLKDILTSSFLRLRLQSILNASSRHSGFKTFKSRLQKTQILVSESDFLNPAKNQNCKRVLLKRLRLRDTHSHIILMKFM